MRYVRERFAQHLEQVQLLQLAISLQAYSQERLCTV